MAIRNHRTTRSRACRPLSRLCTDGGRSSRQQIGHPTTASEYFAATTQTPFLLLGLSLAGFAAASKPIATFEELAMLRSASIRITASSEDGHAIAGVGSNGCCTSQAFRWDRNGPVQRLVPPPGQADSFARAISADGQVVLVETRGQDPGRVYGYRPLPVPGGVRSADPAFFSPDARTLHGVGYAVGAETGDVNVAVAVSWRDGRAQVDPPVLLHAAASSGDALLSREDAERMNLNMPFAHAADRVPMQIEWIGANADLVLGKAAGCSLSGPSIAHPSASYASQHQVTVDAVHATASRSPAPAAAPR